MFHEAHRVTIKSSKFAKLLQVFEESADWILFIGVAPEAIASSQISNIFFHFVLRKVLYQTKYYSSLKVKIFGTSNNFGLATSLDLLSSLGGDSNLHVSVFE